jgi:hypothetical protein
MSRGQYQQRGIEMSQEAIDRLEGSWVGRVQNAAGGNLTIVFRFESIGDGSLAAFLDSPDQNVEGIPMTELVLDGDQLSFVVPAAQASFTATLSAAGMDGTWAQGNSAQPVTMTPGEYTPVVAALDLSDAAMQQLAGAWHGTMGPLDLVIRFETNDEGTRLAFLDVPAQGVAGLAIAAAELTGDQVTIRIETIGATFTGTLAGAQMEGNWQQGTNNNPLTLTRDP